MAKPDWLLWLYKPSVTLEQCVCLSLNAEPEATPRPPPAPAPDPGPLVNARGEARAAPVAPGAAEPSAQKRNEWLAWENDALLSTEGKGRLATLRKHFDARSNLLPPFGVRDYYGDYSEKRVCLIDFARWAYRINWAVPPELDMTPKPQAPPAPATLSPPAALAAPEEQQAPPLEHWKMRVQAEAAVEWKRVRAMNCNPTRASIRPHLLKWCRDNGVKTSSKLNPSDGYLRTHVLSARHWTPPDD